MKPQIMKRWLALAGMALILSGCVLRNRQVQPPTGTSLPTTPAASILGTTEESLVSGGEARTYRLHVPPNFQSGTPVPLVLDFHGFAATAGEEEILSGFSKKADEEGFIVAYPQGRGSSWAVGPGPVGETDRTFVKDLIDYLAKTYTIDPKRIYATGISNGGGMVNRLACDMPDVFAAIGPVSGAYLTWQLCNPARPVPVMAFHGTADDLAPYQGEGSGLPPIPDWAAAWAARNGCADTPEVSTQAAVTGQTWSGCTGDASVILYTIEGGGHWWPGSEVGANLAINTSDIDATDSLWEFFQAHPMP